MEGKFIFLGGGLDLQCNKPYQGSNTLYFTELLIIIIGLQTTCTKIKIVNLGSPWLNCICCTVLQDLELGLWEL